MTNKNQKKKSFRRKRYEVMYRNFSREFSLPKLLFEFVFIFAAIILGLYANSKREDYLDSKKEEKFVISLHNDLKIELEEINEKIRLREKKKKYADSLQIILSNIDKYQDHKDVYFYQRYTSRRAFLSSLNPTIEQLKNTGQLNLFKKQNIANKIISYEIKRKDIDQLQSIEEQILFDLRRLTPKILDATVLYKIVPEYEVYRPKFKCKLLTTDSAVLNEIRCNIHYINSANKRLIKYLNDLKMECEELIKVLEENYNIKNND